jgi:hypothetical protein
MRGPVIAAKIRPRAPGRLTKGRGQTGKDKRETHGLQELTCRWWETDTGILQAVVGRRRGQVEQPSDTGPGSA